MSNAKTPIKAGQYRSDPATKGRVVRVIGRPDGSYIREHYWLVRTESPGGRTSTVRDVRLARWPVVDAPALPATLDQKETP
jgi:hypothetical protein